MDKAVGRLAKTTATVSGEKSLKAAGRTTQRMGERKTYVVTTHADGGWKVQAERASRAKGVAANNAEDWREGKLCASW